MSLSRMSVQPAINRAFLDRLARPLPTKPGRYFWDEWGTVVTLYSKRGGKHLYVVPPGKGSIEIRVSARIAGTFVKVEE